MLGPHVAVHNNVFNVSDGENPLHTTQDHIHHSLEDSRARSETEGQSAATKLVLGRTFSSMRRPASAKEVQRFIGKCQYYRTFIPNFSQVAAPLFKAQTASCDFVWTDACDLACTRLTAALVSGAILAHPDYTRDSLLDCDGSGEVLGAALLQAYDEGKMVVAYALRSLLEHETKWTATELEDAALIWALETLRPHIDGVHVTIRTGHPQLEYIGSKTDRCKRLERCALRLQEFRSTIHPRPGTQQKHVDAISRTPIPVESDQQPLVLDEFPERAVLLVRSWDERIVDLLAQGGPA